MVLISVIDDIELLFLYKSFNFILLYHPGDLPDLRIDLASACVSSTAGIFFTQLSHLGSPYIQTELSKYSLGPNTESTLPQQI